MKKKNIIKISIFAMVVVMLILQVGAVSAGDPERYRVRPWGHWQGFAYGMTLEIPAQDIPYDTWLTMDYSPYGKQVNGVWPIWTVFHIGLHTYEGSKIDEVVELDPVATVCIYANDELVDAVGGNPYRLGIAQADVYGWPYVLLRTRYIPWGNVICATPNYINGSFTVIDKKALGYEF